MKFKEDYTREELSTHLNRFVKNLYHDEGGNKIISRAEYESNQKSTQENFKNRILAENSERYFQNKSPVNEPLKFDGCELKDFNDDKYPSDFVSKMKDRALNNKSFYLAGSFGSGKSRFVWAYAKHLYLGLGHRDIIVIRFNDIFKEAKLNYGSFEYSDYFKRMTTCKILLIDDIRVMAGKSANHYDAFIDLMDTRVEGDLVTCFTSNVSYTKLAGDESESKRLATRIERVLGSRANIVLFKKQFYEF